MSTDGGRNRAAARRHRGRRFVVRFAAVLAVLVVAGAIGAFVAVVQGPRVTAVQIDPAAAVATSGSRLILTTTQSLREVDAANVSVEPATEFAVDTSGRNVGVRFTLPLHDDTEYTVTVRDVAGLGAGPAATLEYTFRTPALRAYILQRGTAGGDVILRGDLTGENSEVVFTHPHIEDFRATARHLVVSVRTPDDRAALIVTDSDGAGARELPLPGDGYVSQLQSADRGERIGYTFSSARAGVEGGSDSVLYTASLAPGAAEVAPTEVALTVADPRVAEWRFVPDTDSILVLTFDGALQLVGPDGGDPAPLGTAVSIDGIARGSAEAVVERLEGMRVIDLTDGSESALPEPAAPIGALGQVTPVPGGDAGSVRTYAVMGPDVALAATVVAHVASDGTTRTLLEAGPADAVLQTCVSPSGRYGAVLIAPDAAANPYDRYLLPVPVRVETHVVEIATSAEIATLEGFAMSWCQLPPS